MARIENRETGSWIRVAGAGRAETRVVSPIRHSGLRPLAARASTVGSFALLADEAEPQGRSAPDAIISAGRAVFSLHVGLRLSQTAAGAGAATHSFQSRGCTGGPRRR